MTMRKPRSISRFGNRTVPGDDGRAAAVYAEHRFRGNRFDVCGRLFDQSNRQSHLAEQVRDDGFRRRFAECDKRPRASEADRFAFGRPPGRSVCPRSAPEPIGLPSDGAPRPMGLPSKAPPARSACLRNRRRPARPQPNMAFDIVRRTARSSRPIAVSSSSNPLAVVDTSAMAARLGARLGLLPRPDCQAAMSFSSAANLGAPQQEQAPELPRRRRRRPEAAGADVEQRRQRAVRSDHRRRQAAIEDVEDAVDRTEHLRDGGPIFPGRGAAPFHVGDHRGGQRRVQHIVDKPIPAPVIGYALEQLQASVFVRPGFSPSLLSPSLFKSRSLVTNGAKMPSPCRPSRAGSCLWNRRNSDSGGGPPLRLARSSRSG